MSALTKILIVLQLVFSVACAVLVVFAVSQFGNYKRDLDNANSARVSLVATNLALQADKDSLTQAVQAAQTARDNAVNEMSRAQAALAAKTAEASSDQIRANGQITSKDTQVATLTAALSAANESIKAKDTELAALRPNVESLTRKNGEVSKSLVETTNQLRAAELTIRKLQEELTVANSSRPATGGTSPTLGSGDGQVTSLSQTPSSTGPITARISDMGTSAAGRTLISIPLGTRDGVQMNTKLMISRNNSYIGEATITYVTPDASSATVTSTKAGETVQASDTVSTLGGR